MRGLAIFSGTLAVLVATLGPAMAQPAGSPDELIEQGLKLAKQEKYPAAMAKFRAADDIAARAETACYIALTHGRMGQWGRAHLYYQRCRDRAAAGHALPPWSQDLAATIDKALAKGEYARLSIIVEPPVPDVAVTVSAFPGERVSPGRVFVPAGVVTVTATAPEHELVQADITVSGGEQRVVELALEPSPASTLVAGGELGDEPADDRGAFSRRVMWGAFGTAGAFLVGGVVFHGVAAGTRGELADAPDLATYEDRKPTFQFQRTAALACYGIAAVSAAIGAYLYFSADDEGDGGFAATAIADDESAMAQVIWVF